MSLLVARETQSGRRPGRQSDDAQLVGKSHDDETEKRLMARLEPDEKRMQHLYPRGANPSPGRKDSRAKLPAVCRCTRGIGVN